MYKDKDKQREANRNAMQRLRDKTADSVIPGYKEGYDKAMEIALSDTQPVIPSEVIPERTAQGNIRVSKPGDDDYVPQCETTKAFIEDRPKRPETGKRGKDIKCFEDLPTDVQLAINHMTDEPNGKVSQAEKAKRTAIAIKYQHLFPGSYENPSLSRTSSTKGASL